jgi:hypothetical protein
MAAGTYYWTDDDGDGDVENPTGNNWRTAAGAAMGAGHYPGELFADSVVYPSWAAGPPTVNIDQGDSACGIVNLTIEDGYGWGMGTRELPTVWKCASTPVWTVTASGELPIYLVATTVALTKVNVQKTAEIADALHLVSVVAITVLNVQAGYVTLDAQLAGNVNAGATALNAYMIPGLAQPEIVIDAPVGTLSNRGAKVTWKSGAVGPLIHYSGSFLCAGSLAARTLAAASKVYGGLVDLTTGVPGTITLGVGTLVGAIAYLGGEIRWDVGENLQRS